MIKPDFAQALAADQPIKGVVASALLRVAEVPPIYWRVVAFTVVTLLAASALLRASLVVDGTRYFWLDDDQMISMRYARNLADGNGLVWNPGERVEGYTNPLWTVVMAGVHWLPVSEAHIAVVIRVINWALIGAVLVLSERLLCAFVPRPGLALAALLGALAVNVDVLYWAVNGFETTLLCTTFLFVIVRLLEEWEIGRARILTYLVMGCMPLIRSDAYHLWAATALVAIGLSTDRLRTGRLLMMSLFAPVLHVLWRQWYYGDWLPNTYYLKVAGIPQRTALGLEYLARFGRAYCVPLAFACVGVVRTRERRRWLLAAAFAVGGAYVLTVGEDLFAYSRFLAHLVPVAVVLAIVAIVEVTRQRLGVQALLLCTLWLSVCVMAGTTSLEMLDDENGEPRNGLVTGLLIQRFTNPQATIAVVAAGNVSYFSQRYALDMLGKSDRHIAHEPAHPGSWVGHNKYDPEYTLGLRPDLVVPFWPHKWVIDPFAIAQSAAGGDGYIVAVVSSPSFERDYRPNPVTVPFLLENNAVYVRNSSPELTRRSQWREPQVGSVSSPPR